jgi:hypothetical protein
MVSNDFAILIMIAGIVSLPVTYYALSKWLTTYVYRTELSWWIFPMPILAMIIIVMVTVGQHALKASMQNPVESLRNE